MGVRDSLERPKCWDFAMDFLGCPENEQVIAYVERLEAALAQQPAAVVELTDDIQVGVDIGANSESVFVVVMRKEGEANKIIYSSSHIIAKQSIARTDLTDDEIIDAFGGFRFNIPIDRIRAVIAAHIAKQSEV